MVWYCKFAFSLEEECTLAFCTACKEERFSSEDTTEEGSGRKKSKRTRRVQQTDIGVNIVTCCPKGGCGKHTEADLVDLVEQNISKDYLRASRKKKKGFRMGESGSALLGVWKRVLGKGKHSLPVLVMVIADKTP